MKKTEIGGAVDTLISIKDNYPLRPSMKEAINDICNLVDHNINYLSDEGKEITPAEHVCKQVVRIRPVEHHYEKTGEEPYIKYGCPICEAIARDYEPEDDAEGTFIKFSFGKGTANCPVCGVNFAWDEKIELLDNTDKCKNTGCDHNVGFTPTCMFGKHHMECRRLR